MIVEDVDARSKVFYIELPKWIYDTCMFSRLILERLFCEGWGWVRRFRSSGLAHGLHVERTANFDYDPCFAGDVSNLNDLTFDCSNRVPKSSTFHAFFDGFRSRGFYQLLFCLAVICVGSNVDFLDRRP